MNRYPLYPRLQKAGFILVGGPCRCMMPIQHVLEMPEPMRFGHASQQIAVKFVEFDQQHSMALGFSSRLARFSYTIPFRRQRKSARK